MNNTMLIRIMLHLEETGEVVESKMRIPKENIIRYWGNVDDDGNKVVSIELLYHGCSPIVVVAYNSFEEIDTMYMGNNQDTPFNVVPEQPVEVNYIEM